MLRRDDEAETVYREVLARDPNCSSAMHNLSLILEKHNRIQEALELSSRVVELEPGNEGKAKRLEAVANKVRQTHAEKQRQEEFQPPPGNVIRGLTTTKSGFIDADNCQRL